MARGRKEKTEIVRIREVDAQQLRTLQLSMGLPSIADALAVVVKEHGQESTSREQHAVALVEGQLAARKYTLESVKSELNVLSECLTEFAGWRGSAVTEVSPGEWSIASRLGSKVTVRNGMEVVAVLRGA